MEFIRHRWKMILLVALLIAAILGGHAFLEQHQGENVYRRIVCEGRTAERSCGSWDVNCRESVCGFPAAKSFFKQI